jgi:peptidyl-prolyl cis-trans isomerase A (cyclophilin A)
MLYLAARRSFVRATLILLVLAHGCAPDNEPVTDPAAFEERVAAEEGVAHAQEPRRPRQPQQPPQQQQSPGADQRAPDRFTVEFDTTKGPVLIDVTREWAPNGADRFYTLVRTGYFTDIAMFRVISGFMAQGGIHGDPSVAAQWRDRRIQDDPVRQSNTRGMVTYAMAGPNTRTTQFFINLVDNTRLDGMGFAPFGRVRDMANVDRWHSGYGEGAPSGQGPAQARVQSEGNAYLRASFPNLDYIRSARIVP